ncbi:MAG: hypothetical protein LBQ49_00115 [Rickettsiales bacterium]|jgi:hypothetical protein|nr:hypothetical protein [Rickettsiales bacterium]
MDVALCAYLLLDTAVKPRYDKGKNLSSFFILNSSFFIKKIPLGNFWFWFTIFAVNIFVILLMALFMAGYYFIDAPNFMLPFESRTAAMEDAELKSVLSCVLRSHSEELRMKNEERTTPAASPPPLHRGELKGMPCVERYNIRTVRVCVVGKRVVEDCVGAQNYVITTTDAVTENGAGKLLEILAHDYPHAANMGIISVEKGAPFMMSSGGKKREIVRIIAKDAGFEDGQLAYITQFSVRGAKNVSAAASRDKIRCGKGEIPVFRQGKWGCAASNAQKICVGDHIYNADVNDCVQDTSRRPLCQGAASAVMVDGVWECVLPEKPIECSAGSSGVMNYETMEWECVSNKIQDVDSAGKRCSQFYEKIYGGGTSALRGSLVSCNDCERMVAHDDCTAECVPDAAAASKKSCYAGSCRNFYFGFPDARYISVARKNIPQLSDVQIPLDGARSRNRKFNCMECPYGIDALASAAPYVIVCSQ